MNAKEAFELANSKRKQREEIEAPKEIEPLLAIIRDYAASENTHIHLDIKYQVTIDKLLALGYKLTKNSSGLYRVSWQDLDWAEPCELTDGSAPARVSFWKRILDFLGF